MRNVFADPESLPDIASKACFTGFIAFNHLAFILAKDEGYIDTLLVHWEKYRRVNKDIGETEPSTFSDYFARISIWLVLLGHWTGANDPEYPLLKIYSLDAETGDYVPSRQEIPGFAKMSELREFFTDYLKILPPSMLFPPDVQAMKIKKSPGGRKPSNAQKDKEKAREIANKYIAECESKTPRIYEAVKLIEEGGELSRKYKDRKTIRGWLRKVPFPKESRREGQGRPKKSQDAEIITTT